ncbi:fatty acid synthase-like isoform X3 [Haemaphysalis longicornis]
MSDDDIVISGFSARFPQADSLSEFGEKLYRGDDFVTDDGSRWPLGFMGLPDHMGTIRDLSKFDAQFFGVLAKQAQVMDPQLRLLLETSYEAVFDAGYDPATLRGQKIGVFVGCSVSGMAGAQPYLGSDETKGYSMLGSSLSMFSNRISYSFDFHGPSETVDTACASTMTALNHAVLAIRSGKCEAAIVGGSNFLFNPACSVALHRMTMLSPEGKCKVFDANADGYVRSEAVGAFFVQVGSKARRVYAKLVDISSNADGYKTEGITYPSGNAREKLLRETYAEAKVDPHDVCYVEVHGTGTKKGDPEEVGAISRFFCQSPRERPLMIGSVKSNVGHAEGASGICAMAKVILAMETGTIAGNIHFVEPNPNISSLFDGTIEVVDRNKPLPGAFVGINASGFGGTNVHTILQSHSGPHVKSLPRLKPHLPRLVIMAGRTADALTSTLERLQVEGPHPDSTYALLNNVGQPSVKQFPFRGFTLVPPDETCKAAVKGAPKEVPWKRRPLWYVFTGMGCQWNGMARQMMQFDVFARSIHKSHEVLKQFNLDLIQLVTTKDLGTESMASTFVSITAFQVALVDMLTAMGIKPDGFLGHSMGEIGCAYLDGALTAEQAVLCAYWRGRCTELGNMPKGAMAVVGLTWQEAESRCGSEIFLACHNAADSVTVSGLAEPMERFLDELKAERVFVSAVNCLDVAFHCPHVHNIGPALREALEKVIPEPKLRSSHWVSTSVTERCWTEPIGQRCSADYLINNFLSPVFFYEGLQRVPRDAIVIEIAPHSLLQGILRGGLGDATCLRLMKRDTDNSTLFLSTLGELHTLGVQLDLSSLYPPVTWPVPRGTPSIAHYVSWDHSQNWNVIDWKDLVNIAKASEEVVEVDLKANEGDAYLAERELNRQVLFPAAAYMILAWKSLAAQCAKPFDEVPVIFEHVTIHQEIMLPKSGDALKKTTQFAHLKVTPGDISSIQWYGSPQPYKSSSTANSTNRVLCSVYYAPLNSQDIQIATGNLRQDAFRETLATAESSLGIEFSGRDPSGRRVMGLVASEGMATIVTADQEFLWEVPATWTLQQASTVPMAYSAAYYALVVRGNMRARESLLVHGSSCDAAQAAISIALSMGCTVFTTIGSAEESHFLKLRFPELDKRHIVNCMETSIERHVFHETKGMGVNMVLNIGAGSRFQESMCCLSPYGRFLDMRPLEDISDDIKLGNFTLLKNITFHRISLNELLGNDASAAGVKSHVAQLVRGGIASGAVRPLDSTLFGLDNAQDAFRFMASRTHTGKVVLEIRAEESERNAVPASLLTVEAVARTHFYEDKSYIIIGGLGGVGLELADWMVSRGCRKLLLCSRSGVRNGYQRLCLHRWKRAGAEVLVSTAEVSTEKGATETIEKAKSLGPVGGVFNLAAVLRDALLENQTEETYGAVCKPKVDVTRCFDVLTRRLCPELDHFVVFSSVVCGRGNGGQTNYGYANSVMEHICERRVADGFPALAIQWGAIADVGFFHEATGLDAGIHGTRPQRIKSCLEVLDRLLNQKVPVVSCSVKADQSPETPSENTQDLVELISQILGMNDSSSLKPHVTLGELGLDSMIGVKVQDTIERHCGLVLSMQQIAQLNVHLLEEMSQGTKSQCKSCPV